MNSFIFTAVGILAVLGFFILFKAVRLLFILLKLIIVLVIRICRMLFGKPHSGRRKRARKFSERRDTRSSSEIGKQGEDDLYARLKRIARDGKIFRNLYVPSFRAGTAEIDTVVLNKYGIHVFEYKNYNCNIIIPDNEDAEWIRCTNDGNSFRSIYSPVRQNKTHMIALSRALKALTGMQGICNHLKSYVVFGDGCKIRTARKEVRGSKILNLSELKSLDRETGVVFSDNTLLLIEMMLRKYSDASDCVRDNHIRRIEMRKTYSAELYPA